VNKSNSTRHMMLSEALAQLETIMKQDGAWPKDTPSDSELKAAMESSVPFAVDSIAFESWLAFIFIPKIRTLLALKQPIPAMQITPAAQIYLSTAQHRTINQLQTVDNIANGDIG